MKDEIVKLVTKCNDHEVDPQEHYVWAYVEADNKQTKDIAENHPPVLNWSSSVENLKQNHIAPIKKHDNRETYKKTYQKKDNKKEKGKCKCKADVEKIETNLRKLSLNEAADCLKEFVDTNEINFLKKAVNITKELDPVSHYQLCKLSKKM